MDPKLLSRAEILECNDLGRLPGEGPTPVDVPEWGGRVFVRTMGGLERDEFDAESAVLQEASPDDKYATFKNVTARLLSRAVCDAAGVPMFTKGDVARLGLKNSEALKKVYHVASAMNGLRAEDVKAIAGKSETSAPSGGPGSDSASPTAAPSESSKPS